MVTQADGDRLPPLTDSEKLQRHMFRLHAVVEMGVIGEAPAEQARRILHDSISALGFDYGELGESTNDDGYVRLCAVGEGASQTQHGIGARGLDREKPYIVFDTHQDEVQDPATAALGLRSLLFWPFAVEGKRCVLALGWKTVRNEFFTEEEIQYLNFLAALISQLLVALESQRKIVERADTDSLTGIPNRAAVLVHLGSAISGAQRDNSRVALLYIDLDNFKKINDDHGHAVGDEALCIIADRLRSVVRKHEMCGRLGGDEFCLVVSSFRDEQELEVVARRVLQTLREPVVLKDGLRLSATCSVGIAIYPRDGETAAEVIDHADKAMYRAKRDRSAAFAFYESAGPAAPAPAPSDGAKIDLANFPSQFVLCFQPIVAARSGRPIAAEVLPRWLHPDGMRLPERFLSAARDQGVMDKLDRLILKAAAAKAAAGHEFTQFTFHVNVAEADVSLLDALPRGPLPIALEISEQQVANEGNRYVELASACRARGFRLGLSNFGSGELSLRMLAELRPDFVKINAADMREKTGNVANKDYVQTLIDHAHRMGFFVIGEAIETAAERQWFVANGVDALQGFEIASPLTEQDLLAWLRRYGTTYFPPAAV